MSRPKKHKIESDSLPPSVASVKDLRDRAKAAHADPHNDHLQFLGLTGLPLALASRLDVDDDWTETAEWVLTEIVMAPPEHFEKISRFILKMKENLQGPPSRLSYILTACADFIEQAGRVPAKSELHDFIKKRRQIYKDAPADGDKKGWTRLFNLANLHRLDDRPGVPPMVGRLPDIYHPNYQDKEGNHYMRDLDKFGEPTGPYIEVDCIGFPTGREIPADEWE